MQELVVDVDAELQRGEAGIAREQAQKEESAWDIFILARCVGVKGQAGVLEEVECCAEAAV